jgi:hypothetical protein
MLPSSYYYGSYDYSTGGSWQMIVGLILGILATIALAILVLPQSKDGKLSPFLQKLHDIFNLKGLLIDAILRVLYMLSTLVTAFVGFFTIFSRTWYVGLALLILGPIFIRIFYELLYLAITVARNISQLNKKLGEIKRDGIRINTGPADTSSDAADTSSEDKWEISKRGF